MTTQQDTQHFTQTAAERTLFLVPQPALTFHRLKDPGSQPTARTWPAFYQFTRPVPEDQVAEPLSRQLHLYVRVLNSEGEAISPLESVREDAATQEAISIDWKSESQWLSAISHPTKSTRFMAMIEFFSRYSDEWLAVEPHNYSAIVSYKNGPRQLVLLNTFFDQEILALDDTQRQEAISAGKLTTPTQLRAVNSENDWAAAWLQHMFEYARTMRLIPGDDLWDMAEQQPAPPRPPEFPFA